MVKEIAVLTVVFAFIVAYITVEDKIPELYPAVLSMHVAEGSSKNLSCYIYTGGDDVSANDLTWSGPLGKHTITSMNDISKQILYNNLTIDNFTEKNVGPYHCVYEGTGTEIKLYILRENKIEGDYYHGNKTATLQCTLSFPESNKYSKLIGWRKGNGSLPDDKRFHDYKNGTLVINEPKRTDCDLYTARYKILLTDEIYECQVKFKDRFPIIYPAVNSMHVAEGSSTNLSCCVNTGGANVSSNDLTWTGPSGKFTTTSIHDISKQILYTNLTIDNFTEKDVGGYSCTYQNKMIDVYLYIIRENKIEGDYYHGNKTATLQCTLSLPESNKNTTFIGWLKGNGSLPDDKRFQDYKNGTLVINEAKRTDCDLYIARYKTLNDEIYDCQVKFKGSPLVLDMSKSVNVVEGHTVDLKCVIKGYRIVNVTWLKDDKPIDRLVEMTRYPGNDERACRIRMSTYPESYENACLTIKSVNSSDAGRYTCLATDEDGRSNNKSIIVRVKDELEWLWPAIGIVAEAIVLALIIFACSRVKKDDHSEQPGDERQGLLTEGAGVYRETKPE